MARINLGVKLGAYRATNTEELDRVFVDGQNLSPGGHGETVVMPFEPRPWADRVLNTIRTAAISYQPISVTGDFSTEPPSASARS